MLPFVIAFVLHYYFFLRLGNTPATGWGIENRFTALLQGVFTAIVGSLFSSLSVFGIYGNFDKFITNYTFYTNFLIALLLIALIALLYKNKKLLIAELKKDVLLRLAFITVIMYSAFWIGFVIKKSAVANEDRLFLPATILILPYLIHYTFKKSITKYIACTIVVFSTCYGILTFIYRIKAYSKNMSAYSCNAQLNGFKIFINNKSSVADLNNIAHTISTVYSNKYIITPQADVTFLLSINNKFIISPVPQILNRSAPARKDDYLLLLRKDDTSNQTNYWHIVYKTNTYSLYQPN